MAVAPHRQGPDLVLGRSARRQPGADRADGDRSQEPHVRPAHRHGIQGDRGRLSRRLADRLRFRPLDHRQRPHPRRRRDSGADPVPVGADRAHLCGSQRRQEGHSAFLQLDLDAAARSRVPRRPRRRARDRRRRRQAGQGARRRHAGDGIHLRIFAGELHRHRARFRARGLRGGEGGAASDAAEGG